MRYPGCVIIFLYICLMAACLPRESKPPNNVDIDSHNIKEIANKISKYAPFDVPFDARQFNFNERQQKLINKLVEASNYMESIFWRQNSHEGILLLRKLETLPHSNEPLLHYLRINAGPFDLVDENKPFILSLNHSAGGGLYPKDLTKEEFNNYIKAHPEQQAELESPYTVVRREGDKLIAVPYREKYKAFLVPASNLLKEAADLTDDAKLRKFLLSRADALLSDDYFASDLDWLDITDSEIDIIFGPYETYVDALAGIKTSYSAGIMIRDRADSEKLKIYQQYLPELEKNLPLEKQYQTTKSTHPMPMVVNYNLFRSGDLAHGYQAVATNLPNDPRVQQQKGSKKYFFKNFMNARVDKVIMPIAQILMTPEQAKLVTGAGYFNGVLMHEICHGLGPDYVKQANGTTVPVNRALGDLYSALEEEKADICGLHSLIYLTEKGINSKEDLAQQFASYLGGILRTVRFGTAEAHGQAEIAEYNYLLKEGAISYDEQADKYRINSEQMPAAVKKLAAELLEIQATGDRARAEKHYNEFGKMPDYMKRSLEKVSKIPVDIEPNFSFPIKIY